MADEKTFRSSNAGLDDRRGEEWFTEIQKMNETIEKLTLTVNTLSEGLGINGNTESFFSSAAKKLFGVTEQKTSKTFNQSTKGYEKQLEMVGTAIAGKLTKKIEDAWDKKMAKDLQKLSFEDRLIKDLEKITKKLEIEKAGDKFKVGGKELTSNQLLTYLRKHNDPSVRNKFNKDIYDYVNKLDEKRKKKEEKEEKAESTQHVKATPDRPKSKRLQKAQAHAKSGDEQERQAAENEQEQEDQEDRDEKQLSVTEEMGKLLKVAFGKGGFFTSWRKEMSNNKNLFSGFANLITSGVGKILGEALLKFAPDLVKLIGLMTPILGKLAFFTAWFMAWYKGTEFVTNKILNYFENKDLEEARKSQEITRNAMNSADILELRKTIDSGKLQPEEESRARGLLLQKQQQGFLASQLAQSETSDEAKQAKLIEEYKKIPASKLKSNYYKILGDKYGGMEANPDIKYADGVFKIKTPGAGTFGSSQWVTRKPSELTPADIDIMESSGDINSLNRNMLLDIMSIESQTKRQNRLLNTKLDDNPAVTAARKKLLDTKAKEDALKEEQNNILRAARDEQIILERSLRMTPKEFENQGQNENNIKQLISSFRNMTGVQFNLDNKTINNLAYAIGNQVPSQTVVIEQKVQSSSIPITE